MGQIQRITDPDRRVIHVGSPSPTLAPGLPVGYLIGTSQRIREARVQRRPMTRQPPTSNLRTVTLYRAQGDHDAFVRRKGHARKDRWTIIGRARDPHLPHAGRPPTFSGTAICLEDSPEMEFRVLDAVAESEGVLIEPGDLCFMADPPPRDFFRLGYGPLPLQRNDSAIAIPAELIDHLVNRKQRI